MEPIPRKACKSRGKAHFEFEKFKKNPFFFINVPEVSRRSLMVLNWSPSVFRVSESPSDPIDAAFRHSVIFLKIDFWGSKTTFSRALVILQVEKSVFRVEKNQFFGFDNDRRVI